MGRGYEISQRILVLRLQRLLNQQIRDGDPDGSGADGITEWPERDLFDDSTGEYNP